MLLKINYLKGEKVLDQALNVTSYGTRNLGINLKDLENNLKYIKSITYARVFDEENKESYSLENLELINEVLLFLSSLYSEFSLVIKQNDDGRKVTIYFSRRVYNCTEIIIGKKTFISYLSVEESIEFAENLFSKMIKQIN